MTTLFILLLLTSITCLIIGLIKPKIFSRIFKKYATRKKLSLIFGGAIVLFFILIGATAPKTTTTTPKPSLTATGEIKQTPTELYQVVSVTDGDTLKVSINGNTETIRLIGMDTPETVDPRKTVQCFGKEASNRAKEMLEGKKVRIESDVTQGDKDKYDRLLRYIYLEDGTFFNKYMISEGYAHEYTYNTPYKYQEEFKKAEKDARDTSKGLWATNTCNGDTTKPAATPAPTSTPANTAPVVNTSTSTPTPANNTTQSDSGFTCSGKTTCGQMTSCAEANFYLNTCGVSRLDGDKDGTPCESICK